MKLKKLMSLGMAVVMTAALAVPAFAEDTPPKNTLVISGAYSETDIAVTVPTSNTAVINPYGLGLTATKADGTTKVDITGQIVSTPQAITNESGMTLNVGATVTGEIPLAQGVTSTNAMKFSATTTKGVGTDPEAEGYVAPLTSKSAYVNLEVVQAPASVKGADAAALGDLIIDAAAADATWTGAKSVNVGLKAVEAENLAVLKPATMDGSGEFSAYPAGSAVMYRLTGDCVTSPKVAWAETDTFKVTVVFTFTPAGN